MPAIESPTADASWRQAAEHLRTEGKEQPGRGEVARQLLSVQLSVSAPTNDWCSLHR